MTLWEGDRATTYVKAYMRERLLWDTYSHNETDSWGSPETTSSAQTWSLLAGTASYFDVAGGVGTISIGAVNASQLIAAGSDIADVDFYTTITVPVVASGATIQTYLVARLVDASNYYGLKVGFDVSGTVDVEIEARVGGSGTTIDSAANAIAYAAGDQFHIRFRVFGTLLQGKVWAVDDDEPDAWQVEAYDQQLLSGSVGFRVFLTTGNLNTLPVVLTFDDVTAYSRVDWIDITGAVSVGQGLGQPIEGHVGRQTELAQIDETNLSFALLNFNGWFTPDNVLSPYWPDWKTGVPVRWSETIGARTFTFPDTWLEIPEVTVSFEAEGDPERSDRILHLSAVDLLTRLKRAPKFVSNLAAYIVGEATPGALRAYWPLVDGSGSTYATAAGPVNQDPLRFETIDALYTPGRFIPDLMNFGIAEGPPGDDGTSLEFTQNVPLGSGNPRGRMASNTVGNSAPTDSGIATVAVWVYVPSGVTTLDQLVFSRDFDPGDIYILIDPSGGTQWLVHFRSFTGVDAPAGGPTITSGWHLVAGRIDFSNGDIEIWVDDNDAGTNTLGGGGTNGKSLDRMVIDGGEGSAVGLRMAHLQLYVGDASAFTREDFLAQYDAGVNGWLHQTVDQRIRMVCNYAGIGDGQLELEESDSPIQPPAWAGQSPGDLAAAAATTGGGILFTRGQELIYHDRKHRFGL